MKNYVKIRLGKEQDKSKYVRLICHSFIGSILCYSSFAVANQRSIVEFDYDEFGRVIEITHPDKVVQTYQYNDAGISEITYGDDTVVSNVSYNHNGNIVSYDYQGIAGTGMTNAVVTNQYDGIGRLSMRQLVGNGQTIYKMENIAYNRWGFVESFDRHDKLFTNATTINYGYSPQAQLTSFTIGTNTVNYTYDETGNLVSRSNLSFEPGRPDSGFTLPTLNNNVYDTVSNQRDDWQYDDAGRVIQDDKHHYKYNNQGRLVLVTEATGDFVGRVVAHYLYNAGGQRVRVLKDNVTYYNRDIADRIVNEYVDNLTGDADQSINYVLLGNDNVLTVTETEAVQGYQAQTDYEFTFTDRMGNPVVRWDKDGEKLQEYSPYGKQLVQNESDGHAGSYGFTGHEDDKDTGLVYMRARYYNGSEGRFMRPDPARDLDIYFPSSMNLYQYVSNNPVNAWDPTGLVEEEDPNQPTEEELDSFKTGCSIFDCFYRRVHRKEEHDPLPDPQLINEYNVDLVNTDNGFEDAEGTERSKENIDNASKVAKAAVNNASESSETLARYSETAEVVIDGVTQAAQSNNENNQSLRLQEGDIVQSGRHGDWFLSPPANTYVVRKVGTNKCLVYCLRGLKGNQKVNFNSSVRHDNYIMESQPMTFKQAGELIHKREFHE